MNDTGDPITLSAIGIIHSPFVTTKDMPIQPSGAVGIRGTIEVFPAYQPGLKDLEGFSHLILLYYFHQATTCSLIVRPFLDATPRGVFATRAPVRPNHLGLSIVKLVTLNAGLITVENLDILNGTPLLDIKPYVPEFDSGGNVRIGWLEGRSKSAEQHKSDDRFKNSCLAQVSACEKAQFVASSPAVTPNSGGIHD